MSTQDLHPADVAKLDEAARRVRAVLLDAQDDIEGIKHAVIHATDPQTVPDLLAQLALKLDRAHSRIDEGIQRVTL